MNEEHESRGTAGRPPGGVDPDGAAAAGPPAETADLHARRQRTTRRILLGGTAVAVAVALAVGAGGGSGRAGMVFLLLLLALTTGSAGLWSGATLLYDDLKKRGTTRGRIVTTVALFVGTGMLMAMVVGAGTSG